MFCHIYEEDVKEAVIFAPIYAVDIGQSYSMPKCVRVDLTDDKQEQAKVIILAGRMTQQIQLKLDTSQGSSCCLVHDTLTFPNVSVR